MVREKESAREIRKKRLLIRVCVRAGGSMNEVGWDTREMTEEDA